MTRKQNKQTGRMEPTHGMTNTPTWETWRGMRRRCYDKKHNAYADYGAKGIFVCDRWRQSFENFFADMGERPDGMSLDRINSKGNYDPTNCRWADDKTQGENKCSTKFITFNEKTLSISEWARQIGISPQGLWLRLNKYNWSIQDALTHSSDPNRRLKCRSVL